MNRFSSGFPIFILTLLLFLAGLVYLGWLRFAGGDVYPPYSSLRADPVGAKLLHEVLVEMDGITVERNFTPYSFKQIHEPPVLFLIGLNPDQALFESDWKKLSAWVGSGGRMVLALKERLVVETEYDTGENGENDDGDLREDSGPPSASLYWHEILDDFGLVLDTDPAAREGDAIFDLTSTSGEVVYPWKGRGRLDVSGEWRIFGRLHEETVAAERAYGNGSVVVLASPFMLSNEFLAREQPAGWIVELLGGLDYVIMDEVIHGVVEHRGVLAMIREGGLSGVLIVFLAMVILLLWRLGAPFLPRTLETPVEKQGEHGQADGLARLLGRHCDEADLKRIILEEGGDLAAALPEGSDDWDKDSVALYNKLVEARRKRFRK